ncbi:MAG: bifunctional lysine ketoglutarate reductase /saccharopine dehydrogenase family protein [Candidatus Bipolaricaulota bacterium]|nr:bifunctional lysine ketoglutarate reductase /saccharopine dehydrogenase family protein [Candidatus Bipolaricaulota bacterium]
MNCSKIGVRREDKYEWERRAPLVPEDAKSLDEKGIEIIVQSSPNRVFTREEYERLGISVKDDISVCPVILGIKEIPLAALEHNKVYVFFSHTVKGQVYNMPMLQRILDLDCTLIDYEKITDADGRRLIFFGNYAGLAGMIETLWALGRRLAWEGIENPFTEIKRALDYPDLAAAKTAVNQVGKSINSAGLPKEIAPLVVGFAGYGNVSRGAQEIFDLLPVEEVPPGELAALGELRPTSNRLIYKVVFKEEDMVEHREVGRSFDLQEYYDHPEFYRGIFKRYLPHLDVLINAIYWEEAYPRLVTKGDIKELTAKKTARPRVIGDISCDIEGAIECTVKSTDFDDPVYVYDPVNDRALVGVEGNGPVIMAVDILPAELPRESSAFFSEILRDFIPGIATADFSSDLDGCSLPPEIKRAVIVYNGELTPDYRYLKEFVE